MTGQPKKTRREFLTAARTPSLDTGTYDVPVDEVPIPPADADVLPTACEYCIVGCAYKVYRWPYHKEGGAAPNENAFKEQFPTGPISGKWVSPNMHSIVQHEGEPHHVVIVPDGETAVNRKGNHSVRGGTLGLKPYNPTRPTAERLQTPMVRSRGMLHAISWDDATTIAAELGRYAIEKWGVEAWGIKYYSYQFWENTYALTKWAYGAVGTPAGAEHDKNTAANDATGVDDAGVDGFSYGYPDVTDADVIMVSGSDPYENHTILFTEWIAPGGAKIIQVNPRKSPTAAYAERTGGLHLQLTPGTDSVLNNAIARYIVEKGWEDREFITRYTVTDEDLAKETSWRRKRYGGPFEAYKAFLLADDAYTIENAAKITGVPAEKLILAAEMLAKPRGTLRPKASFFLEKGNYWSFNFPNTCSYSALGLLNGASGRPGRILGRLGGHQRGMMKGAGYPMKKSTDLFVDPITGEKTKHKKPLHFDRHAMEGNLRYTHVIGHTWVTSMSAGQALRQKIHELTRGHEKQVSSLKRDEIIAQLKARMDAGGMALVVQETYPNDLTEYVDLVLPAATWGETDLTRAQGERRLRIYSKFYDPPGSAKPDWWIVGQIATKMGYKGFAWKDGNEVFEEASKRSKGGHYDYTKLIAFARSNGLSAHEQLRALSTTGIQLPARIVDGKLVGTIRLHDKTIEDPENHNWNVSKHKTKSGKAIFMRGDWRIAEPIFEAFKPKGDELWVLNGRINHIWQTMYDDLRKPYIRERWPMNWLFINHADAKARGIENGDLVHVTNDAVVDQLGGTSKGVLSLVAYLTDEVAPGVTYTYAFYPGQNSNTVVSAVTDPVTAVYNYKIGKGRVEKAGETPLKSVDAAMSFIPRSIG